MPTGTDNEGTDVAYPSFHPGVGTTALFDEARALGRLHELREAISRGLSICRGPKAVAALHKEGIAAS